MNRSKFFILLMLVGCSLGCQTHVLTKKAELSRDHTFISFEKTNKPYVFKGEVGGEHINYTKIIAFEGDQYKVEVSPESEQLELSVEGKGIRVEDIDNSAFKKKVTVDGSFETFIVLALTAHPSETFTLTITPLKKQ